MPCFALPAGALPYPCPSLGDGGLIQERLVTWVKFQGKTVLDVLPKIFTFQAVDTLPEWSKGVDSSSTSANCVGSSHMAPTQLSHPHQKNKVWLQQACSRPQKLLAQAELSEACHSQPRQINSTPRRFEPLRAEPIGFRVQCGNQAKSLTPRQSNFPAVHVFSAFCFSLCCLCLVLHCLQEPCLILVLHWATAG